MNSELPPSSRASAGFERVLLDTLDRWLSNPESEQVASELDCLLRPRLRRYFQSHGQAATDAEDLVQNTLERVYLGVRRLEHREKLMAWLFTIARNVRITAALAMRREVATIQQDETHEIAGPAGSSEGAVLTEERIVRVRAAIEGLPVQQRQCIVLRAREDMSYEEIAELLHLSSNTVRNHLSQARKSLRRVLPDLAEDNL